MEDAKRNGQEPTLGLLAYNYPFSILALIFSNMIPLWGVIFRGWDVFAIMLLFWLENVVVGIFNVGRMVAVPPYTANVTIYKFFLIPFFVIHYGIFALAHGAFVFVLFCPKLIEAGDALGVNGQMSLSQFWTLLRGFIPHGIPVALGAIFLSHGVSFVSNFLMRGECRLTDVDALMTAPYRRVILLHLTLIASAFIVAGIGAQKPVVAVLVLLKIVMDLMAHRAERKRYEKGKNSTACTLKNEMGEKG